MNFDLEYDYAEALKRQGHKQSEVDALRKVVEQNPIVPKSITNKQVSSVFHTEASFHKKISFSSYYSWIHVVGWKVLQKS